MFIDSAVIYVQQIIYLRIKTLLVTLSSCQYMFLHIYPRESISIAVVFRTPVCLTPLQFLITPIVLPDMKLKPSPTH